MIIKKNQIIYICQYCGKKSVYRNQITMHERTCKSNPKNWHKCFQYCEHLEKDSSHEYGEKHFTCALLGNKKMYSFKLEYRIHENKGRIERLERMPLKCKHYECSANENYLQERSKFENEAKIKQKKLLNSNK